MRLIILHKNHPVGSYLVRDKNHFDEVAGWLAADLWEEERVVFDESERNGHTKRDHAMVTGA